MSRRRRWTAARRLAIAAIVLLVAGFLLTVDNPTVHDGDGPESSSTCAAPYDTVVHDAVNYPDVGPPPAHADAIAAQCREAGRTRYAQGIALMGLGGLFGAAAALARLGARLRARRPRVSA
ncbi:hypothetical protein [Nocardioides humi]|uniref:Uncharacterized protein n=1 Tax=Nocardioides humi TaxID=449461 RepID=A0ABN2BCT0_9ACTN|nr:hypothetical protein [Nocardioides humi]